VRATIASRYELEKFLAKNSNRESDIQRFILQSSRGGVMKLQRMFYSMVATAALGALSFAAAAQETIKIAYIDPLSGPMAATGEHGLHEFQFVAEQINARGGVLGKKLEIVPLDNKLSPQESQIVLKSAIDQGVRYVTQGNGSSVAGVLIDQINKHNARDPANAVVFLNYAAVDPDFTNSKCSFWHFRFDANSDMKMEALTNYMAKKGGIKKVYVIGQDYSFGHQVARAAKEMIKAKMPGTEIVGDELHPLARVKDFAPYIQKIKASGADTVITGNWGSDLVLLIKASKEAGLNVNYYTYYAGVIGTPTALGESGVDRVKIVSYGSSNLPPKIEQYRMDYQKKHGPKNDPYTYAAKNALEMLTKAMTQAGSAEPLKVARAMEGMKMEGPFGEVEMRKVDHQMIQPLFIGTFAKAGVPGNKFDAEGTGFGFKDDAKIENYVSAQPTSCKMERPQ
jgi:branched-chain amino acid transport system substrate-binding protein